MKALAIDIFAGGLTVGVKKSFQVLAHLEHNTYGAKIAEHNLKLPVYTAKEAWPDRFHWRGQNRPEFIYGNPPCAPFSNASSGRRAKWHQDPRLACTNDVLGLLALKPTILATESVPPAWTKGQDYWKQHAMDASKLGYATTILRHNAQDHGVPQNRPRLFFVFHKVKLHLAPLATPDAPVTVREAWRGLKIGREEKAAYSNGVVPTALHRNILPLCEPGDKLRQVFDLKLYTGKRSPNGKMTGRPSFQRRRLEWDKPAPVVGGDVLFHPVEDRHLYPSELHRLVTFPDSWNWLGITRMSIALFVSRGVAPKVGEWLGKTAKKSIEKGEGIRRPFLAFHNTTTGERYEFQ